jgi:hypothetical protein
MEAKSTELRHYPVSGSSCLLTCNCKIEQAEGKGREEIGKAQRKSGKDY